MVKRTYNPQNTGGAGDMRPVKISDDSAKILRQGEEYIKGLQAVRDAESQQQAQYINDLQEKFSKEQNWQQKVNSYERQQAQAFTQAWVGKLTEQARRTEQITGRSGSITGGGAQKWLSFVLEASQKAASAYGKIRAERKEAEWDQSIVKTMLYPISNHSIAWNRQFADQSILGANAQTMAAAAEMSGADPSYVNEIRQMDAHNLLATKQGMAQQLMRTSVSTFQKELLNPETEYTVNIPDGQGGMKQVPLNQLNQNSTQDLNAAWTQFVPALLRKNGFGDADPGFLAKPLGLAQTNWNNYLGEKERETISTNEANLLDNATNTLRNMKDPMSAQNFYFIQRNLNGNNHGAARAALFQEIKDVTRYTDDEFEAIGDMAFPGMDKPIREQYKGEWGDLVQERQQNANETFSVSQRVRNNEFQKQIDLFNEGIAADYSDGKLDLTEASLNDMVTKARQDGNTKLADHILSFMPQIASRERQDYLDTVWNARTLAGNPPTLQEITQAGNGLDEKWLMGWANRSTKERALLPTSGDVEEFEKIAFARLDDIVGSIPGAKPTSSVLRAQREVSRDFLADFKIGMGLHDGNRAKAIQYAEQRLEHRLETIDINGVKQARDSRFRVSTGAKYEDGKLAKPGIFDNATSPIAPQNPFSNADQILDTASGSAIETPGLIPKTTLEKVVSDYTRTGRFKMPPIAAYVAERTVDENGRQIPAYKVLIAQMEANGVKVPADLQGKVKAYDKAILEPYRKFLESTPSQTRTDIGVIGSGGVAIYGKGDTPLAQQVKAIVSKRESPNAGYDAINRGRGGDTPGGATRRYGKPLTQMTLGEVKALQARELNAVGKYQFIEETLAEAAERAGITDNMLFNEAVQDRIFFVHLDDNGLYQPWERWWIEQGGPGLATTAEEKEIIRRFREEYDPKDPWEAPRHLNPAVIKAQR